MDMDGGRIDNAVLKAYGETLVGGASGTNTGSSYDIDISAGNAFFLILNASCTFTFSNPSASGTACSFTLILKQDGTGSRTATWPAAVRWSDATAPTLGPEAYKVNTLSFLTVDGGTNWFGVVGGTAYNPGS